MMDGEEEEEVRPKRGKSIRLPENDDLEAQRYKHYGFSFADAKGLRYFLPLLDVKLSDFRSRIHIKPLLLMLPKNIVHRRFYHTNSRLW